MYFYFDNKGEVSSYSEGKNDTPEKCIELEITYEEKEKLKDNWKPYIKNNKLVLEKTINILKQEKIKKIEEIKTSFDKRNAKDILKDLLEILN
ncbi:MAG: hypothetical protein WC357_03065 [Candidatus Omnitrophota bacterium]|jgi:hypothetical protein